MHVSLSGLEVQTELSLIEGLWRYLHAETVLQALVGASEEELLGLRKDLETSLLEELFAVEEGLVELVGARVSERREA